VPVASSTFHPYISDSSGVVLDRAKTTRPPHTLFE
jgi:hypothetical protein